MQTNERIEIHLSATTSMQGAAAAIVSKVSEAGSEEIATYCYREPGTSQMALLLMLAKYVVEDLEHEAIGSVIKCKLLPFVNTFSIWGATWRENGWRTSTGKKPKHCELIKERMALLERSNIVVAQATDNSDDRRCELALQNARLRGAYFSTPSRCIKTTPSAVQITMKPN